MTRTTVGPATLCLASWLAPGAALAELNFREVILDPSWIAYERDVGDIDGDGDSDLVAVQEGDTTLQVFRAPEWTRSTLVSFAGAHRYPRADDLKVADIDGDGDLDIVTRLGDGPSSDGAGLAVWCENLGGGSSFAQRPIGASLEYVKDIVVADFDRDGRLDVAMRMDSRTQLWLQDPGASWTEVVLAHPAHEGMEAGDLDMDGDPDLILNGFWFPTPDGPAARAAANYASRVIDPAWFDQTGDWTANSCKVVVGDFDGDGANDAAFSHSERAGHAVAWYRSSAPGGAGPWTRQPVLVVDYCHTLLAADWDLDGDADLLAGGMTQSRHRGLRLLLNDGAGSSWTELSIQSDGSYSAEAGDIDDDGDLDIVGIRNWNSAPTYIYRSNAAGGPSLDFWRYHQVADAHARTFGLCFPDADGDGDLDIASGPFVYRNPGLPMTSAWPRVPLPGGVHAFATLDVDGDDRADLLAQRDDAGAARIGIWWVESANSAGTDWRPPILVAEVPRGEHPEGFQGYRVAQIVAGGRPEIAVSTTQGIFYLAVPESDPAGGAWPRTFVVANDSDEGIGVADIDGDGDLDIGFTAGGSKQVRWARNPGDGTPGWSAFTIGSFPEADWPDRCEAADLNGDGRVDLIATEENSGSSADALACWWEQPAAGATSPAWPRRTAAVEYTMNSLDAADLDRDGDVDLVLAEHRGTRRIAVWENDGSGGLSERLVDRGRESHLGGRTADLDGDGDLDLVSIAYDDYAKLHLWRNDSPGGAPSVARPGISPGGGEFDEPLSISLSSATAGASIWFTTDGTQPGDGPPASLFDGTPIPVTASLTIEARAFKAGFRPSSIATATFIGPKVRKPQVSPPGGAFASSQVVTLSCPTAAATIRLTTDGDEPLESDAEYSGPLVVTRTTTVKARAFRPGLMPSDVAEGVFALVRPGIAAHWRLDERSGAVAADSSGNGRSGNVVGATWATGRRDNALRFDGIDDRIECGNWDLGGAAMTIAAWVKLDPAFVDNDARVLSKAIGIQEQDHSWMLSTTTSGGERRLRARLKAGGSTATLVADRGRVALDTWHHVAATYDGAALALFLDGEQVGSTPKTGAIDANAAAAVWIGANPPTAYAPFRGLIDDVRILDTALDAAGVKALMSPGTFIRGDANGDASVDIGDPVGILLHLFASGPADCEESLESNGDGAVDIADPIYLLGFFFLGGPPPAEPYPEPGLDPEPPGLGCERS